MRQPRKQKSRSKGRQIVRRARPDDPVVDDLSVDRGPQSDNSELAGDSDWLHISEVRRREIDEEAELYLAELEAKIGKSSPRHTKRAEALVESIRRAQQANASK